MRVEIINSGSPSENIRLLTQACRDGAVSIKSDGDTEHLCSVGAADRQKDEAGNYWTGNAAPYTVLYPEELKTEAQPDPLPLPAKTGLKGDAKARKNAPVARGVLFYFPDAVASVAELSRVGNEQHNAGQPMHWAYGKSSDHGDCILRHQADYDEVDTDGVLHATKVAWRALAQLQTVLEKRDAELNALRQAQRDRQARGER